MAKKPLRQLPSCIKTAFLFYLIPEFPSIYTAPKDIPQLSIDLQCTVSLTSYTFCCIYYILSLSFALVDVSHGVAAEPELWAWAWAQYLGRIFCVGLIYLVGL